MCCVLVELEECELSPSTVFNKFIDVFYPTNRLREKFKAESRLRVQLDGTRYF